MIGQPVFGLGKSRKLERDDHFGLYWQQRSVQLHSGSYIRFQEASYDLRGSVVHLIHPCLETTTFETTARGP